MEARRSRRTLDRARKTWYADYRRMRFTRWFSPIEGDVEWIRASRQPLPTDEAMRRS